MKGKKLWISLTAVILVVALTATAGLLWYCREHQQLEELRNEALEKLDRDVGQYDEQSIVLHNTTRAKAEKLAELYGAKLRITKNGCFATLTLPEGTTIRDVYAMDKSLQYIEEMAADYQVSLCDVMDTEEEGTDERQPQRPQYTVTDEKYALQTYLDYLNMGSVWNSYTGHGVTVAVIDSGIDTDHPEFAGRISEYSYNASQDKVVKDFVKEDGSYDWSLIEDENGHGTAVTGVIAAAMNGEGIVGIAPDVEILTIKANITKSGAFERVSDLIFGIYYAIERDVQVVNMSFGGYTDAFKEVLQLAYDSDVICVAGAGNDATATLHYPSSDEHAIGVGALELDSWELASYSNFGENLDLVAPGTTYTTVMGGGYANKTGTSMATPVVTAVVALFLQTGKYQTFDEITEVLYASCYDLSDLGKDWYYGFGALDASAFILEERGTITYEMLTDEVKNMEGIYIQGHTLQELPAPERLYAVFDGWYYDDTFAQKYNYYEDKFYGEEITLYAKWANEDDGVPYTYVILDDGTVEIRSYTGHRRYITIPEKIEGRIVSSIGDNAFRGNQDLREVGLPSGLRHIGVGAFLQCSNLVSIQIPENVVVIGDNAFADNIRLSTVAFLGNSKLETIGLGAFQGCGKLEKIELPASLRNIDATAFYAASALNTITVQQGNMHLRSIDGVLYNFSGSTLVAYPMAHGTSFVLPEQTTTIGRYAFALANLKEIDLGNVVYIKDNAFINTSLETISIPDATKELGEAAFAGNGYLTEITLGSGLREIPVGAFSGASMVKHIYIPKEIVSIGETAFFGCGFETVEFAEDSCLIYISKQAFAGCEIQKLTIPASVVTIAEKAFVSNPMTEVFFAENSRLNAIESEAFSGCPLQAIRFPTSLQRIGDGAFEGAAFTEVIIPKTLTNIGGGAFAHGDNLQSITVEEGNPVYRDVDGILHSIDGSCIHTFPAGKAMDTYTMESTVREVFAYAFAGVDKVRSIVVPEGVTQIGERGFQNCGAYSYSLPSTLITIGNYGFSYNTNLYDIRLPQSLVNIEAYAFSGCVNLSSIQLPESLEHIGEYAFSDCIYLWSIHIPDNVVNIGRYAFSGNWNMHSITFGENSKLSRFGFATFANTGIQSLTIPANITAIAQYAFENCNYLTSITFADNSRLESITAYMFDGCDNLQSITFAEGSALKDIQAHAFDGLDNLQSIDFGNAQFTNVDNFAFRFCEKLSDIHLPETLLSIGRYAFYGCKSLSQVTIPEKVEHVGSYAFLGTADLELYFTNVDLPIYLDENWDHGIKGYYIGVISVEEYGDYRYATMKSGDIAILEYLGDQTYVDLRTVDWGGAITVIGGAAFEDSAVQTIILPETLTAIQAEAFRYTKLESVVIPAGVNFIGREAFAHTDIATLVFAAGSKLSIIEQYAFEGTKELTSVTLPASLTTMGTGVFQESGLTSVIFEEGIQLAEIPQRAFANTHLEEVTLPDSVTVVNHNAFNNVQTLKRVHFGKNDGIRLMSNAFYHTGLTELHIPANVTYIGEYCFVALPNLTAFTVDDNNPNYKAVDGLLMNKSGRKLVAVPAGRTGSLVVPEGVEEIGFGAFEESRLSEIRFPDDANILTFGYRAFFKAENITTITVPKSVVSIDYYAFGYCTNLREVIFAQDNQLKGIYEGAFIGCIQLDDIMIPDSIVEISDFAFYGCSKITELPISEKNNIKGIYDYAFAYTGLCGEFTAPETLLDIGNYAFLGTKFTQVTIPNTNAKNLIIGIGAFEDCNRLEEITLPFIGASYEDENISWFGYIFGAGSYKVNQTYVPESLKTVTITAEITFVGVGGFNGCNSLENINLPDSISILWNYSFSETVAPYTLAQPVELRLDDDSYDYNVPGQGHFGYGIYGDVIILEGIKTLPRAEFSGCSNLNSVTLPDGIETIEYGAFYGCNSLTSVTIPESVTKIVSGAFEGCNKLSAVHISDVGAWCNIRFEGVKANPLHSARNLYLNGEPLTQLTVPENVTEIAKYAFYNCETLVSVVLPDHITSIGDEAFYGCKNLAEMEMPDELTNIGSYAFYMCESLADIDIPDNVTTIGSCAFAGCGSLTSVVIPNGVTSIEIGLFSGCTALEHIVIPDAVTSISAMAFQDCTSLSSITIPHGVAVIPSAIFKNCVSLSEIIIPDGVTNIESRAFEGCTGLTSVEIGDGVTNLSDSLFSDCTGLQNITFGSNVSSIGKNAFYGCTGLTDIRIPDSVTSIGRGAFSYCSSLREVQVGKNVTSIAEMMFYGCGNLESIQLPTGLTDIGNNAFGNCQSLKQIEIPNGVTMIGQNAFQNCFSLESLSIPDSVTELADYVCQGCNSLKELDLGNGITRIGYMAFIGCPIEELVIPDSVISIGAYAFRLCERLTEVTLGANVTDIAPDAFAYCRGMLKVYNRSNLELAPGNGNEGDFGTCGGLASYAYVVVDKEGNKILKDDTYFMTDDWLLFTYKNEVYTLVAYLGDDDTAILPATVNGSNYQIDRFWGAKHVIISEGITEIPDSAFRGSKLETVTLPTGLIRIGNDAFSDCSQLTEITIPDSVTTIGDSAFYGCSSLTTVGIPGGVTTISNSLFYGCSSLVNVTISDGVTAIHEKAFYGCDRLSSLEVPDSVTSIGVNAFPGSADVIFTGDAPNFLMQDGVLYLADLSGILYVSDDVQGHVTLPEGLTTIKSYVFQNCTAITGITIPDSVTSIERGAFQGCTGLTKIVIPDSVTTISPYAFADCTGLQEVTFPSELFLIEQYAFQNCASLKEIALPESLGAIGTGAFQGCATITEVTLPDGVTYLESYTFENCTSLQRVVLPEKLTGMGWGVFSNCTALAEITLPSSLTQIGAYTFRNCTALETIVIPNGVRDIGRSAFENCTGLKYMVLPDSTTSLGEGIFSWCTSLTQITLPKSITNIPNQMFYECGNLTSIVIPDSVVKIGDYAFCECSGLQQIVLPTGVTHIGNYAFQNCTALTSMTIPGTVTEMGDYALAGCTALERVTIGKGVTAIGNYMFYECDNLTDIQIPNTVKTFGSGAFAGCERLESITIPEGMTRIEGSVFQNCASLTSITIPNSVTSIGSVAFYGCISLKSITIPDSVTKIEGDAFNNCTSLTSVVLPKGLTTIKGWTFWGCSSLKEIEIPAGVTVIEQRAFAGCTSLESITIPDSVTQIGEWAFIYCENITNVYIQDLAAWCQIQFDDATANPMYLGSNLYVNGKLIKNLVIPEGVTRIGRYAFRGAESISSVTIPASVTNIDDQAFYNCTNLKRVINHSDIVLTPGSYEQGAVAAGAYVVVDKNGQKHYRDDSWLETEDYFLFTCVDGSYTLRGYLGDEDTVTLPKDIYGNTYTTYCFFGAKHVIVPEGVTAIDNFAFYGSQELESIVIPDGVTHIGEHAIAGCPNLYSISLPDSVKTFGQDPFTGNNRLYTNPEHYYAGMLVVNGWVVDVDEDTKYMADPCGLRGVLTSAYNDCSKLKCATYGYYQYAGYLTNVETLCLVEITGPLYGYTDSTTLKNVVISSSVDASELRNCPELFGGWYPITGITIFVEALEEDLRWDDNFPGWSNGNKVYYGDQWHWVHFYDENGNVIYSEPCLNSQIIRVPVYEIASDLRYHYEIAGWDLDGDGKADSIPATSIVEINARPVVVAHERLYTVQFADRTNGSIYHTVQLPYGASVIAPANPQKQGYDFQDWSGLVDGLRVTGDMVIYASWQHHGDGHVYAKPVWVDATCTEPGYYKHACTICGEYYGTEYTEALGHAYGMRFVAPGCLTDGYTLHECSRCDDSYRDQFMPATGHSYGNWIVDSEPQCEKQGSQHRDCAGCGNVETDVILAAGHTFCAMQRVESTCTKFGTQEYCCTDCGMTIVEELPLNHHAYEKKLTDMSFLDDLVQMLPDSLSGHDGDQAFYYECADCRRIMSMSEAEEYGIRVESVVCRHEEANWMASRQPDCQGPGVERHVCSSCDQILAARTWGEPTDHSYEDGNCIYCSQVKPGGLRGDLDLDGDVDAYDLTLLARHVGGIEILSDRTAQQNADVNRDGDIDANDLTAHARYVGGIITDWDQDT